MDIFYFFIVNSRIGKEKMNLLEKSIAQFLSHQKKEIHYTEYGGHATHLAQEAIKHSNSIVVAVGGDGTVNEIIQKLANTGTPLAIIPTGSGNGLARHCKIPMSIPEAMKLLSNGHFLPIDLGKINEIFFISNAGLGFDAIVCESIKRSKYRGFKMYLWYVIKHYFSYKKDEYTIEFDKQTQTSKAFFLNIANGKEFGYGFQIAPQASLQDGLFDVLIAHNMNLYNGAQFVVDGWRKRIHLNKNCTYFTTKNITISGSHLKYFQTDGDAYPCVGTCKISMQKNALQLLVPSTLLNL